MTCRFCLRALEGNDHAHCAAISDLAAFRGTSFAVAEKQFLEDASIERAEAQMLGKTHDELVGPVDAFDIEE